ncbi:ribonuclease H-like protein [Xylariaceae sp. AK1471]|nr:ribonuclease H-like protein [Xylariaceae sp. AK1471]
MSWGQVVIRAKEHEDALRHAVHATTDFKPPIPRIVLFTDGSDLKSRNVCSAAVTYKLLLGGNTHWVDDAYGLQGVFGICQAEIVGVYCALRIAYYEARRFMHQKSAAAVASTTAPSVIIFTDSLAVINRFYHYHYGGRLKTDHVPVRMKQEMFRAYELLKQLGCQLEFHWLPSHSGVEGNERANRLASIATHYSQRINGSTGTTFSGLIYPLSELVSTGASVSLESMEENHLPIGDMVLPWKQDELQKTIKGLLQYLDIGKRKTVKTTIMQLLHSETAKVLFEKTLELRKRKRQAAEDVDDEYDISANTKKIKAVQHT